MFLLDVTPDVVGFAAFGISFLMLLGTILFFRHSKKELAEIGQPSRKKSTHQLEQRAAYADTLALRLEEKQKEFFQLQHKYLKLEHQTSDNSYIAIELEEARLSINQLQQEKQKREQKLGTLQTENENLREELFAVRQALTDITRQKQDLQKKISVMEDMETEWQVMAEKNNQLQTKVRRIGELESMLSLMKEERSTGTSLNFQ